MCVFNLLYNSMLFYFNPLEKITNFFVIFAIKRFVMGNKKKPKERKNEYLKKLDKYLVKHKIDDLEDLAKDMSMKDSSSLFEQSHYGFATRGTEYQQPFSLAIIRKLYLALGINPEEFLVKDKEKDYEHVKNLFTSQYWDRVKSRMPDTNHLNRVYPIPPEVENNTKLLEAYQKVASKYEKAKKRIISIELLMKGKLSDPNSLSAYQTAQSEIYGAIEAALLKNKNEKNTEFKYSRIFSLYPSEKYFPKASAINKKTAFVIEASEQALAHMMWCLNNYPDNCEFFITRTSYLRHNCLIDNDWLLNEDYIILASGFVVPHCLFLDDLSQNKEIKEVRSQLEEHIENLHSHKTAIPFMKEDMEVFLDEAEKLLLKQKKIKEMTLDPFLDKRDSLLSLFPDDIFEKLKDELGEYLDQIEKLQDATNRKRKYLIANETT